LKLIRQSSPTTKFQKEKGEVEEDEEEKLLITRDTRDGRAVDCGQK
jgi:hypothetical protein